MILHIISNIIKPIVYEERFEKNIEPYERQFNTFLYIEQCKLELKKSGINKKSSIECMLLKILEEIKAGGKE